MFAAQVNSPWVFFADTRRPQCPFITTEEPNPAQQDSAPVQITVYGWQSNQAASLSFALGLRSVCHYVEHRVYTGGSTWAACLKGSSSSSSVCVYTQEGVQALSYRSPVFWEVIKAQYPITVVTCVKCRREKKRTRIYGSTVQVKGGLLPRRRRQLECLFCQMWKNMAEALSL